ncbi:kinase-like domain-containing protein [Thelephora terrestris]|uniref:Kinase-like domain-containing protein n=1 Tax=Thelephora terrestris TaxID=56493 RepID=A0A9P6HDA7_9AGAM|nr:kinase-like domain-containing protein [Thelephora terrestris]
MPLLTRFHLHAFICSGLSHSNIVPFLGVFSSNQFPCACIFKLVGNECLREYLVSNPGASRLKLVTKLLFSGRPRANSSCMGDQLVDIARGLHHIHDLDIVHRRIKDTNIRISDSGTAMIAGFASATLPGIASEGVDESAESNASRWCSPEIIRSGGSELTKASDIYAFGMLAYEIFSGRMPFHDKLDTEAVMIVTTTNQRPPRPIHQELSGELWHMIERCWQEDPSQRPTIQEVVAFLEK